MRQRHFGVVLRACGAQAADVFGETTDDKSIISTHCTAFLTIQTLRHVRSRSVNMGNEKKVLALVPSPLWHSIMTIKNSGNERDDVR